MFLTRVLARQRVYSTSASKPRSGHADFYASLLPAMIPVALLGSAVYMVSPLVFPSCPPRWRRGTAQRISSLTGRFSTGSPSYPKPSCPREIPRRGKKAHPRARTGSRVKKSIYGILKSIET
ncbi:hypothetical protein JVT61DRAFT_12692 [Boletus reticuloceps]|uniref:Uncharacterized protein n=1 Tax=Boletus reticuloceps TaxID=495285 RepID=A0A8I2YW37_9AGAM|nr:hypothetical protein JVT61DRAFT_12692 [Boletus reticuloceps]